MTVGAGQFWTIEAAFRHIKGVTSIEVGYSGGELVNPTEDDVEDGKSGHVEVVQLKYDSKVITFEKLL